MQEVPDGYLLQQAIEDGLVVMSDGDVIYGQEKWGEFLETTAEGKQPFIQAIRIMCW